MDRDPLQTLVYLVATEANPHHLVLRVVSESFLLRSVRHLCLETCDIATDRRIREFCISFKIPIEYFRERLQLIARILNLIPYEQNYYEILEVSRSATLEEIKQSFRRLSFSSHPDTNPDDPDAAERFHNFQHAYEVLRNDKLRQSYDQNLGTHAWTDEEFQKGRETAGIVRWWEWRKAWPVGALLLLLVLITLMIDYRQWQTARYYARVQAPPARQVASSSSPPPGVSVEPLQEIVQDSPRPPITAPVLEPVKPPSIPETPSTPAEKKVPLAAALMPAVVTKNDETSPKPVTTNTGAKTPASLAVTAPKHAADAKPLEQKPHPVSEPGVALPTSGEPGGIRPPTDKKPAGPASTPSAMQQTPPSTRPGDTPAPAESMVHLQDLDRKIHWFLARYASTYEAKNPVALLRFFETDAVENGKPIQHLIPVYQANFQRAEKLRYRIDVRRWEVGKDEVKVDGSFRLSVQFLDEAPVESAGSIQLTLIRRGDDFGVKRLDYSFK